MPLLLEAGQRLVEQFACGGVLKTCGAHRSFEQQQSPLEMSRGRRGPKGWQLFAGTSAVIFFGFWRLGTGNKRRNEQTLFERRQRYALAPLLQNEADQQFTIRENQLLAQEKAIMSLVPGWEAGKSQYNSSRWTPPHIMDSIKSNQKK
jgi:NADH dehydrogenase (ubiquinone) 1 alpha subcomplex subunit 13